MIKEMIRMTVLTLMAMGFSAAFGGVRADAVAVAKEHGIGIDDMKGVPGEFKVGDFAFRVTIRNLEEKPLRGDVHYLVAESDDEEPKFKSLASGRIDLTLKSVKATADRLGYCSPQHFATVFRKTTGKSPRDFAA